MNLYVVLAIALGAITGVSKAPVAQPRLAAVSAAHESRGGEQQAVAVIVPMERSAREPRAHQPAGRRRASQVPLAGAATPRAPATNR